MALGFMMPDKTIIPATIEAGSGGGSFLVIEAGASGGKRFRMRAYSGGPLTLRDYPHPVIADLDGMEIESQSLPIHRDHDSGRKIGTTDRIAITANGVEADGELDPTTDDGGIAVAAAKGGIDWEASIGAPVQAMEFYGPGQSVTVNGKSHAGPVFVARKTRLKEISIVRRGADVNQTHVAIAASHQQGNSEMSLEAIRAENTRIVKINQVCKEFPDIAATAIEQGWTFERAKETADRLSLERLRSGPTWGDLGGFSGAQGFGGRHSTGAAGPKHIAAALLVKAGHSAIAEQSYGATVMEQSKRLHSMALPDLCAIAIQIDGKDVPIDRGEIIKAGLSGTTLPTALGDSAHRVLELAYMAAPATWRAFCDIRSVSNFKTNTGIRPSFLGGLSQLGPNGEIKHGTIEETYFTYDVSTYAKMYSLDRQTIVNDDLGILSELMPSFGRAASRKIGDLVYTKLLANTGSFFHTNNNNVQSGGSSALSATSLGVAIRQLRSQTDEEGNAIDMAPATLLVPPELEFTARALLVSAELAQTSAGTPTGNAFQGAARLEVEPRLSNSSFSGYSATQWFLFASPSDVPMITAFLDGRQTPTMESFGMDHVPNKLEMSWRCYHDAGVAFADHRAAQRSAGA